MKQILSRLYEENFMGHVVIKTKSGNSCEFDLPNGEMSDCNNNSTILKVSQGGYIYYIDIASIELIKIFPKK